MSFDQTTGLENLYRGHQSTPYKIFEPLNIDGYPAVRAEQVRDTKNCTIYVGLAETQAMWISARSDQLQDNCPTTKRAISAILSNLPPLR